MQLKTKRLTLRELNEKDKDNLVKYANNLLVSRYLLVVPFPYKEEDAVWFINHCKENSQKKIRTSYELAISLDDELIGLIGLTGIKDRVGTIGYWLGEPFWRKGYISEALKEVIKLAKKLKLKKLKAGVFTENEPSSKLLLKSEFKITNNGNQKIIAKSTGKEHDEIIHELEL